MTSTDGTDLFDYRDEKIQNLERRLVFWQGQARRSQASEKSLRSELLAARKVIEASVESRVTGASAEFFWLREDYLAQYGPKEGGEDAKD